MTSLSIQLTARVGEAVGLGHWGRSRCLASELDRRGHRVHLKPVPDFKTASSALPPTIGAPLRDIDVQVVDDPQDALSVLEPARKRVALDFYGDPGASFDVLVNIMERTPAEILGRSKARRKLGLDFVIVEPEATKAVPAPPGARNALIVLGGKDVKRNSLILVRRLKESPQISFDRLCLILPSDHPDFLAAAQALNELAYPTELKPTQPSIISLLQWSTFVICNGGTMAVLAMLQDRNALFFPQTDQEAEFLRELGLGDERLLELESLRSRTGISERIEAVRQHLKPFKTKVDGLGSQRVAEVIENA